jgi:hypothetical protein
LFTPTTSAECIHEDFTIVIYAVNFHCLHLLISRV